MTGFRNHRNGPRRFASCPPIRSTALPGTWAANRTMISVAWALTRQDHGEQPFWAAIALASMLGQIGLPGTGLGFGYSAMNNTGLNRHLIDYAAVPQGRNPGRGFHPGRAGDRNA